MVNNLRAGMGLRLCWIPGTVLGTSEVLKKHSMTEETLMPFVTHQHIRVIELAAKAASGPS